MRQVVVVSLRSGSGGAGREAALLVGLYFQHQAVRFSQTAYRLLACWLACAYQRQGEQTRCDHADVANGHACHVAYAPGEVRGCVPVGRAA